MPTDRELYAYILALERENDLLREHLDRRVLKSLRDAQRLDTFVMRAGGYGDQRAIAAARAAGFRRSRSAFKRLLAMARDLRSRSAVGSSRNFQQEPIMAIPRTTSPGAKRLDVKDVSLNGSGQHTPATLPSVSHARPDAPQVETPRASDTMSTGQTEGNFKLPESSTGPGFPQVGADADE